MSVFLHVIKYTKLSLLHVIFFREEYVLPVLVLRTWPVLFKRGQYLHLTFLQICVPWDNGNVMLLAEVPGAAFALYWTLALHNMSLRFLFLLKP